MKSLIVAIFAVTMLANCNEGVESQFTRFVVRVDSIAHTSFAASNDTIGVRFFGTIGNDGCHSFSHFETARQALRLDVTVWGQRQEASACPGVMVYLEGKEYKFVPAQMGWLKIIVHQPDGSVIKDSIIVK
jgi:hypothetical protein